MHELSSVLTAELLVDGRLPLDPAISPDGRWVAYVIADATEAVCADGADKRPCSALWLAPADASAPPRKLTEAGTAGDWNTRWSPDSLSLLFTADGQLHRTMLDGTTEPLTSRRGGIRSHLPLADGRSVAVLAPDEPTEEDERRRAEGDDAIVWHDRTPRSRLWLLDLDCHAPDSRAPGARATAGSHAPATRALRAVDGLGGRHVVEIAQRPDDGPLALISWACTEIEPGAYTARLHVLDPATGAVRDLGPTGLEARSPVWWRTADSWHLAYLAMTPPGPVGGMAVFDVAVPDETDETAKTAKTDEATPQAAPADHRDLTTGMNICPTELVQITDGPPLALFADGLDTALFRLDPDQHRFHRLSTTSGDMDMLAGSRSAELITARVSTSTEPWDVHAGPPEGPLVRLGETNPELAGIEWGRQERLSYRAADGLELDGLLILPPGRTRADGPFPLLTLVHGGPYGRYADALMLYAPFPGQWLATAGYAVFLPNPRGGQGHGHAFAAAVTGAVGQGEWTDLVTGVDLLIAEKVADPDRLGIGGWSHGGFMAAWAVGRTARFKAAVMGAGISDWGMQVGAGELGTQEAGLGGSCGWEGPGPHRHDELSPVSLASGIRTPVLILHGENDTNVPLGQATYFHRALDRFAVEHAYVVYPREGHRIRERNHRRDLLDRTRAWFDQWLAMAIDTDACDTDAC